MPTPLLALPLAAATADVAPLPPFTNPGEALLWATEVLRRRQLPRSSGTMANQVALSRAQHAAAAQERLNLGAEATLVAAQWGGRFKANVPQTAPERFSLALQIEAARGQLPAEQATLLKRWAWGDWAEPARLHAALHHQEKLRRQGVRARLSYRYSVAQLALLEGTSKATLWRRLQAALAALEPLLIAQGVLAAPPSSPAAPATPTRQTVNHRAFKGRA